MSSAVVVDEVVRAIIKKRPDEFPEDWEYVAQIAVEAMLAMDRDTLLNALGMELIDTGPGFAWITKGDR